MPRTAEGTGLLLSLQRAGQALRAYEDDRETLGNWWYLYSPTAVARSAAESSDDVDVSIFDVG